MKTQHILSGRVGILPAGLRVSRKRTFGLLLCDRKDGSGETPEPAGKMPTLPGTWRTLLLTCLASLILSASASASSWWNGEWTLRRKVTLDASATGAAVAEPIGASWVLVRLHDGNFQFPAAKDDASDIRFVAEDDKTALPFHIEKYDALLDEAFIWVKLPDVKANAKTAFWLYYGNSGNKAVRADDAKATFDADAALVYHFAERGQPPSDATGNGNNAQNPGVPVEGSLIGSGVRFDGKNSVTIPASASLAWSAGGAATVSLWIKPAALAPNAIIFSRRENESGFVIGLDNGAPFLEVNGQRAATTSAQPLAANSWHHLAVTAAAGKLTLFLDGESAAALNAPLPALNSPLTLGNDSVENAAGFSGEADELEISKIARTVGFIKLAALSQAGGDKAAKLIAFGEDEQPSSLFAWLKGGTFGVIVGSLTADGWAVIGILAVMAVMSWFVMISKVRYLNGLAKGNALFLRQWEHIATDLTVLDDADEETARTLGGRLDKAALRAMRNASVFRIYHTGVSEIRRRIAADKSAGLRGNGLSGRSIQAIRASLDGVLVRETQKINRLIVLLTICISGGPFLGLLGTVIGVMITFAAVAAAGDVNVNAIAPGIAAALLATVAGLAVAIPSLFGYNYILSRVKDARDDMHIFIDEFATKMAEFHRERDVNGHPAAQRTGELVESAH